MCITATSPPWWPVIIRVSLLFLYHVVVTKNNIYGRGFVGPEERARGEIVAISSKYNILLWNV